MADRSNKRIAIVLFAIAGVLLVVGGVATAIALRKRSHPDDTPAPQGGRKRKKRKKRSVADQIAASREHMDAGKLDEAERELRRVADAIEQNRELDDRESLGAETHYLLGRIYTLKHPIPDPPKTLSEGRARVKALAKRTFAAVGAYGGTFTWKAPHFPVCSKVRIADLRAEECYTLASWKLPPSAPEADRASFQELLSAHYPTCLQSVQDAYEVVVDYPREGGGCMDEAEAGLAKVEKVLAGE
jgi:hypothetical protein